MSAPITTADIGNINGAAVRLFKAYESQCAAPNADTLFAMLTAMHSLSERLKAIGRPDFHDFNEYIALKALRNFAVHQDEVRSNVRIVPSSSDLAFLCLVRRDRVEKAIATTNARWAKSTRVACEQVFHWYGPAVNINPALFNLMVRIYERLDAQALLPDSEATTSFAASYKFEEANCLSHFVDGRLFGHAADISAELAALVADLPEA